MKEQLAILLPDPVKEIVHLQQSFGAWLAVGFVAGGYRQDELEKAGAYQH